MRFDELLLAFVVLAPGAVFVLLSLVWLLGWSPAERIVSAVTGVLSSVSLAALAVIIWRLHAPVVAFGNWFAVHSYRFPLVLMADGLSLPFLAMTVLLSGLIGQFSATYLHRESGFLRFFVLLHLFTFGSLLAFAAGSFDLLVAGWELVGHHLGTADRLLPTAHLAGGERAPRLRHLSSLRHRSSAGRLRAAPLGGHGVVCSEAARAHRSRRHRCRTAVAAGRGWQGRAGTVLRLAPRAPWKGPTPSSAIFYGAISIHAGAYLLLRAQPWLAQSTLASLLVVLVGIATAIHGTLCGRASADAKTSLAYASLTQVGRGLHRDRLRLPHAGRDPHSGDTPWSARSSSCGRRPCCMITTACTRPWVGKWP